MDHLFADISFKRQGFVEVQPQETVSLESHVNGLGDGGLEAADLERVRQSAYAEPSFEECLERFIGFFVLHLSLQVVF